MKLKSFLSLVSFLIFTGSALGQYTEWTSVPANHAPEGTIRAIDAPARAINGLTFYTVRANFDAAAPGLTLETFGSSVTGANQVCADPPPLSSATNDSCYTAGDLLPDYNLDIIPNGGSGDYVLLTTGFIGVLANSVGANSFAEDTALNFPAGVGAVGFDLVGPGANAVVDVNIYSGNTLLGTTQVTGDLDGTFFGVTSTDPITMIELIEQGANGELIQNMAFGSFNSVPTMGTTGIVILLTLMVGTAVFMMRRKTA